MFAIMLRQGLSAAADFTRSAQHAGAAAPNRMTAPECPRWRKRGSSARSAWHQPPFVEFARHRLCKSYMIRTSSAAVRVLPPNARKASIGRLVVHVSYDTARATAWTWADSGWRRYGMRRYVDLGTICLTTATGSQLALCLVGLYQGAISPGPAGVGTGARQLVRKSSRRVNSKVLQWSSPNVSHTSGKWRLARLRAGRDPSVVTMHRLFRSAKP
jgi:hypothetical protein